jgi:hypothetical protein
MIVERPFLLDDDVSKEYINGIHFEYEWDSFLPIACPLNTKTGYCGGGEPLALFKEGEDQLFPKMITRDALGSTPEIEREALRDQLSSMMTQKYVEWFMDCWKQVRHVAPKMRGFVSVHDTTWRVDLDTGEKFEEGEGKVKFF